MTSKIRRFYRAADVAAATDGFAVVLDGRPVRTPAGRQLAVPVRALADALAEEWQSQGETLEPTAMPLTQLASTAIDRVGPNREAIVEELLRYATSDLLCYRAEQPRELVERQNRVWQPLLDWATSAFDVRLAVTAGVIPVSQPEAAVAALRRSLGAFDDWRLTALQAATAATGSLILALSMAHGRLSAADAFAASQLDELYQAELWGDDAEAEQRRARLRDDVDAAGRFFAYLAG